MRRFARIHPDKINAIQAKQIDQIALKIAWTEMHVQAEEEMTRLADSQPYMPIGVAFVDVHGRPGWIADDHTLNIHYPCIYGCLPTVHVGDDQSF